MKVAYLGNKRWAGHEPYTGQKLNLHKLSVLKTEWISWPGRFNCRKFSIVSFKNQYAIGNVFSQVPISEM
jgi:hypothetical protein